MPWQWLTSQRSGAGRQIVLLEGRQSAEKEVFCVDAFSFVITIFFAAMCCQWQVGMVFVRCGNNGISHSPLEYVAPKDVAAVTIALYQYLSTELL